MNQPVDRDRARTRLTVGEGFPIPLFRLRDGVTVSPWCTFPEAPLKCRTARFPGSGFKPWPIFRGPSQGLARFKRWFVCTPATPGLPTASPAEPQPACVPVLSSRPPYGRERPPSVQSPFAQLGYYLRWGDVQRLLRGHYPSVRVFAAEPVKPISCPLGPMAHPLELAACPANDISIDPDKGRTQLRRVKVTVVVDPAADARVVYRGQLSQG